MGSICEQSCSFSESPGGCEPSGPDFVVISLVTYHGRKGKDNITNSTTSSSAEGSNSIILGGIMQDSDENGCNESEGSLEV